MDYLIGGLGNPGKNYLLTRHNVGFLSIDVLCQHYNITVDKKFKKSYIGKKYSDDNNIIFMKPLTYMNLSGKVILSGLTKFRILPENLIVIYDDIDLPLGKIRIRKEGSSAGHKGVQSIIDYLNNDHFIRIRIGINSEAKGDLPAENFVLKGFSKNELKIINKSIKKIPDIVQSIMNDSIEQAMNDFN